MEISERQKAILQAICHFDALNYPLSPLEILNFCRIKLTLAEVIYELNELVSYGLISTRQGVYFLIDHGQFSEKRLTHYRLAQIKLKRARLFSKIFIHFPFVRAVALYSSLALKNSDADSDIDFFIIAKENRLWTARFFINSFIKITNQRPKGLKTRDKICISYLADENHLNLSASNAGLDWFNAYSCGNFIFLSNDSGYKKKFFDQNRWISDMLPNFQSPTTADCYYPKRSGLKVRVWLENILGMIEEQRFINFQKRILPKKYWLAYDGKKVIISDFQIKLHENSKKENCSKEMAENYEQSLSYVQKLKYNN